MRELKITGLRVPHYNRRADLVCFVNGLPLVFIELKAVYRNIRAGFDDNLTRLPGRAHHRPRLPPQRLPGRQQRRPGPLRLDHQQVGALRRVEAQRREATRAAWTPRCCSTACWPRTGCWTWSRTSSCSTTAKPGGTRKIVARNHQVLGVNSAVASVHAPGGAEAAVPAGRAAAYRVRRAVPRTMATDADAAAESATVREHAARRRTLPLVERAHPDLGRLGVFWHTQGSGKSYSMAFFAEKVRRVVPGNFTFVLMTDRDDLDDQIWRTFVGCGVADEKTPRAGIGRGAAAAAQGEPPLRLQPDPQVQPGREPGGALQRARRHHRHLGRGAPHAGGQVRPQHAAGAAERRVHRLHRHAALQARRADQAHLRRATSRATTSSAPRRTASR